MITIPQKKVAIVACTGMAGQQFVEALDNHPWFSIESLHGFSSAGFTYREKRRGFSSYQTSEKILNMKIKPIEDIDYENIDVVFSAVPGDVAESIEGKIALHIPVISTASFYRYQPDVPIFLPFVNGEHFRIFDEQKKQRNWNGFVCPGPNCTTVGLAISSYPIFENFGLKSMHAVSMQAISGGGYPGVPSYDILGNVVPHIPNEEGKVIREVKKIFANLSAGNLEEPSFPLDAKCNRVPVVDGHLESVFIQTEQQTTVEEITHLLQNYRGQTDGLNLPNAPEFPIKVFTDNSPYRPQPRIDLKNSSTNGMITFVGGIEQTVFENGFKFTVLSHNTELGAGRGGVLSAEYLTAKNYI
ncbi:aspartate-semialdehyde dehydrogenase [Candidatus Lokiarchaeum ossiferum]|uniref:aspartate-semialdehyde dehydrogenase n=1 Tax=Candidatus Lokiarchaeum ossiferum TaxID=2951803 RepID=UPI00352EB8D8